MKRPVISLLLSTTLLLGGHALLHVAAQQPGGSQLSLLSSNAQEIILELTVADYETETVSRNGELYRQLRIPGTVQTEIPGEPQVPTRGTMVGLPTDAGVSIEIIDAEFETLSGFSPPPAAELQLLGNLAEDGATEVFRPNQTIYGADAFYPTHVAAIGETGLMRDQAVAAVHFYPVQVNPVSKQVKLYHRIRVRITWNPARISAAEARIGSAAFEPVLQSTLLNYDSLSRPSAGGGLAETAPNGALRIADSAPALKIGVTEDGMYQLTYSDIVGAGFSLAGINPQTIKITNRGQEIPLYLAGENDGVFDPTDTILFYGTAVTDVYTSRNVYWLTAGGGAGKRMAARDGTPHGAAVPSRFPATLRAETDALYWQTMPNGAGQDHWFWDILTAPITRTHAITLNNIATTAGTATVRLSMKGFTDIPELNPDHHTRVSVNGTALDPGGHWWDGQASFDFEADVSQTAALIEGANTVTLESISDTGAAVDRLWLNWIEIDYWDTYVAENDQLRFAAPESGTFQFEVSGFTGSDINVFDITNPTEVMRITNTAVVSAGGSYLLRFEDNAQPQTRYLAQTSARYLPVDDLELDQPSAWKSPANGADYIIITHEDFYTNTLPLAYRRSITSGLRVATVKVGDIYDEFNDGIFNPQAIQDFLAYAYDNWASPAPTFVLLVGDAVYDFKDNYHYGVINYVPAYLIESDLSGQVPSDNRFVTVSGADIIPDMLIGRLTARTPAQVDDIISKIIGYEQSPPDDTWNKTALLVADDGLADFEATSEELAGLLPADFTANKVYAKNYPPGDPTTDISAYINNGSLLVNYTGHGNSLRWGSWSGGRIYESTDITALQNTGKPTVLTTADCLNGFFNGTGSLLSVAETFLQLKDGGAVAVWAPTGLGYASGHRVLMTEFYKALFQEQKYALGAATTAAKIAVAGQNSSWDEMIETFVFFGDPAMRLGFPTALTPDKYFVYLPVVVK